MISLIYILGGKGFVGSAFVRFCKKKNLEFEIIDRHNYDSYKGKKCDILINANGNSSKILAIKEPSKDFEATVTSVQKSIDDFKFKKYILLSSCDVYPDCSSPKFTNEDSSIDVSKQSTYGSHKYQAEQHIIQKTKNWLIIRLGGMIGYGLKRNAIFDILHEGPLWLDPQSELQFMNTDDVAQIVFELNDRDLNNEIINVCGDGLVKLQNIIDIVESIDVNPDSTRVKYDVNVEKLKKITTVPDSNESVKNFVQTYEVKS